MSTPSIKVPYSHRIRYFFALLERLLRLLYPNVTPIDCQKHRCNFIKFAQSDSDLKQKLPWCEGDPGWFTGRGRELDRHDSIS